ncbi:MAG TPA: fibrobacter succinogenes major paralogous domain-containing protein, partial [Bacteroidales bacterium]|nr:fibrobacter succinogenes major paralogous domain-containing protein [Bacteroidales bacterium]
LLLVIALTGKAQVGISTDNSEPDPSAMLEIKSTSKGLLLPRLTHSEINAIDNPANGLMVYCTDCGINGHGAYFGYLNGAWNMLLSCVPPAAPATATCLPATDSITWNWMPVPGATTYKINNVPDYATATDLGLVTTWSETGLLCNTTYNRFVWAVNDCGPSAPLVMAQSTLLCGSGPCPGLETVSWGDRTYHTILIGNQCWMKENLNIGVMIPGTSEQTDNTLIEKYCYDDLESNCEIYGGLYQWGEVMAYSNMYGAEGICPPGWFVPTDIDWTFLTDYLGGENVAGGKMKESGFAHWNSPNTDATNVSGFTLLGAGHREPDGSFNSVKEYTNFWSSTIASMGYPWTRAIGYNFPNMFRDSWLQNEKGLSLRCLKR